MVIVVLRIEELTVDFNSRKAHKPLYGGKISLWIAKSDAIEFLNCLIGFQRINLFVLVFVLDTKAINNDSVIFDSLLGDYNTDTEISDFNTYAEHLKYKQNLWR